jgi:hypothetical protein
MHDVDDTCQNTKDPVLLELERLSRLPGEEECKPFLSSSETETFWRIGWHGVDRTIPNFSRIKGLLVAGKFTVCEHALWYLSPSSTAVLKPELGETYHSYESPRDYVREVHLNDSNFYEIHSFHRLFRTKYEAMAAQTFEIMNFGIKGKATIDETAKLSKDSWLRALLTCFISYP